MKFYRFPKDKAGGQPGTTPSMPGDMLPPGGHKRYYPGCSKSLGRAGVSVLHLLPVVEIQKFTKIK